MRNFGVEEVGLRSWSWQRWLVAGITMFATAALIGIPTGIIQSPLYTRMTPVLWWNVPVWAASSVLTGLVIATYVRRPVLSAKGVTGRTGAGSMLSLFAVGCPICNKLVVGLIGVSGALNIWAPIQPVLGVASLVLLAYALRVRVKAERGCRLPGVDSLDHPAIR